MQPAIGWRMENKGEKGVLCPRISSVTICKTCLIDGKIIVASTRVTLEGVFDVTSSTVRAWSANKHTHLPRSVLLDSIIRALFVDIVVSAPESRSELLYIYSLQVRLHTRK